MKNIHFVLEGSDGAGKSTIAKLISKKYSLPIISQKIDTFDDIEITSKTFNTTIPQFSSVPFILDRWWISSKIYAKIYKRNDDFSYIDSLKKILPNSCLIYLYAPTKTLLSRKDDKLVSPRMLSKINNLYPAAINDHWYDEYFHKTVVIDTTEKLNFSKIEKLIRF